MNDVESVAGQRVRAPQKLGCHTKIGFHHTISSQEPQNRLSAAVWRTNRYIYLETMQENKGCVSTKKLGNSHLQEI